MLGALTIMISPKSYELVVDKPLQSQWTEAEAISWSAYSAKSLLNKREFSLTAEMKPFSETFSKNVKGKRLLPSLTNGMLRESKLTGEELQALGTEMNQSPQLLT